MSDSLLKQKFAKKLAFRTVATTLAFMYITGMDTRTLEFVTYCIGQLALLLKLPQREVYKRLKNSGILYGYIVPSYDVLHTFGLRYLMEDLTDYMREKGVLA